MTAMARALSRAFSESSDGAKDELLRHLVLFFAALFFVWILTQTYGLDLSLAFF
ncbi:MULTISPECIES: hypothetical protein [unclassified Bradyrhizobium]|uniref:hypothetical protein n=1 Tax=unclassified Bradyrhizobium TaxID=2631580 RepID=UPI0028F15A58|nr:MULTISPECIES: hypothetical protein [unclassified Bradyrhizobium]